MFGVIRAFVSSATRASPSPTSYDIVADNRTHGPDTKEKPYKCSCGSAFSRRDLLQRHERLAHHGGLPEVVLSRAPTTTVSAPAAITATKSTALELETGDQENPEGQNLTVATPPWTVAPLPSVNGGAGRPIPCPDLSPSRKSYQFSLTDSALKSSSITYSTY